jgi:GntR family transcriptional regulator of arabinose operon
MLERRPLYEQVRQQVLQFITEQNLNPGDIIPTEAELASRYGVSVGTVRRALRQLVDQEILYRQPGRGTFLTEHSRQRARRRGFLACIVPYLSNSFVSSLIAGAEYAARRANYGLLLLNSQAQPELEEQLLLGSLGSVVGALILPIGRATMPSVLEELMQRRFPLAFADRLPTLDTDYVNHVTSDNRAGAYSAVQHLVDLGHRRVALALTSDADLTSSVVQRIEGYRQALHDNGLTPDESLLLGGLTSYEESAGQFPAESEARHHNVEQLQAFLQKEKPSSLLGANDLIAMDAWRAAEGLGLSVPEHLSIVGFDDAQFLRDTGTELTTVAQDAFGIGHEAVEVLTEFIEAKVSTPQQTVLPTRLVVRASSQTYSE